MARFMSARAEMTRILRWLRFVLDRSGQEEGLTRTLAGACPRGGRQAEALRPHIGKWVALAGPTEVLIAADSPQEVLAWLVRHKRRVTYGMFRVPTSPAEAEGIARG